MAPKSGTGPGKPGRKPLSPIIHGRVRLMLLSRLVAVPTAHTFTDLRQALHLTDGSLSANLTKLENAGLVVIEKTFEGKRPRTLVRVTPVGVAQYRQYVDDLRSILPDLEGP